MTSDLEAVGSQFFRMLIPQGHFLFQSCFSSWVLAFPWGLLTDISDWRLRMVDTIIHVTFPTLWNLHFFLWAGPGSWHLLAKLRFRRSLSSPCSDDLWFLFASSACNPGRPYCLDPKWKIVLRGNTFLGYLNSHSATFLRVGGWQRDAAVLDNHLATLKFPKGALAGA